MPENLSSILLIIPNLSPGGAQNVFRQHYEHLSKHYTVHGCVFNWDGTSSSQWPSSITSLEVPAGSNVIEKAIFFFHRVRRLRNLKRKLNVAVSVSHLEGADYVNVLADNGDKKILWIHGTKRFDAAIDGLLGKIRKSVLIPWLYKKAETIITVSKGIALEMANRYPALQPKLHTVYNGVNLDRIKELKKSDASENYNSLAAKNHVIITHCRLARQKNLSGLVKIASKLKNNTSIKWVILGDGELRDSLLAECEHEHLDFYTAWSGEPWNDQKQIYFLGFHENPFPFLKKGAMYVMTSSWEGFPLALCEAMACPLPVLASDCYTGPREIISPDLKTEETIEKPEHAPYGSLMPLIDKEDSIKMWADEIEKLINEPDVRSRYAEKGFQRAQELSLESSLQQVQGVINSVLKG